MQLIFEPASMRLANLPQHVVSVRLQESSTGIPHPLQHVDAEARSWAKALAYGLLYGKTAHSFKDDMGCDLETAQRTMDDFIDSLPDLVSINSPSLKSEGCVHRRGDFQLEGKVGS
jgi:hypothetical protein